MALVRVGDSPGRPTTEGRDDSMSTSDAAEIGFTSIPSDIYHDPQLARWLGSMEGVPDWPEPVEAPVERAWRGTFQNRANQVFAWLGGLCPGVVLALGLA